MIPVVIAIDGPAASGKSSVSRQLASIFHYNYINSGAMYRAVTWYVLQGRLSLDDPQEIATRVDSARLTYGFEQGHAFLEIDGFRPIDELRAPEINSAVSAVSTIPSVRTQLVECFRELAAQGNCVVEGRDIGSVVFPRTPFKFYLDAPTGIREQRRAAEGQTDQIAIRDRIDSSRHTAPLTIASDAIVVDTTTLDLDGVVQAIVNQLIKAGLQTGNVPSQSQSDG